MWQAAGLTCKAAGIDLSDFLNFRGSSVEAGSSVTRRQELALNSAGNLQQAWRLGCWAAVDGYVSGLTHLQQTINGVQSHPTHLWLGYGVLAKTETAKWLSTRPLLPLFGGKKEKWEGCIRDSDTRLLAFLIFALYSFLLLNIPLRSCAFS